jgi:hypothetical protein
MKHYEDVTTVVKFGPSGWESTYVSLAKLVDQPVVDVLGSIGDPWGCGSVAFYASYLVLADGTRIGLQGEHDTVMIEERSHDPIHGLDEETLERLHREDPDYEDDDEDE